MDDRYLNPLKAGALFVAPGQIMDPDIMKRPRYPDHIARLRADVGMDTFEAELASVAPPIWSLRQVLERIADLVRRRESATT